MDRRKFLISSALSTSALGLAGSATAGSAAAAPADPAGGVVTGADRLAADGWKELAGQRLGIVTNPTGILQSMRHIVDDMHSGDAANIVAVFGPEHGFRGTSQAGGSEGDYEDPRTGIPVYDAYGADTAKIAEMFKKAGVERVVFDIADVGARFYTYIWTMYRAMEAAQRIGAGFVVLDRPNPIGGNQVAGPMLNPDFSSGVGLLPIVQQHGMTVGELAQLFNKEFLPKPLPDLKVVELQGWDRSPEASDPWVPPSPNMPTLNTAMLYPGTGMFEGTVFSEGRGTTAPFEIIGAPKVDWKWADELNAAELEGLEFREMYFVPTFGKHVDKTCGGVHVYRTGEVDSIRAAVTMIVTARRLYPNLFGWRDDNFIDKLFGSDRLRSMVNKGANVQEIVGMWQDELAEFGKTRKKYLLYR